MHHDALHLLSHGLRLILSLDVLSLTFVLFYSYFRFYLVDSLARTAQNKMSIF